MNDVAQYFDELAEEWEATLCQKSPVQGAVAAIAGVGTGSRVLDLGCGTGIMAGVYLDRNASQVVALDVAPRMIEIAQQKYRAHPELDFRCCDIFDFEDEEGFDAVVIYNAYPHFADKSRLAQKIASLTQPQSRFVVAHSMGRDTLNAHHSNVPAHITSDLKPADEEAELWQPYFNIDSLVDSPGFYCLGGYKKA